MSKILGSGEEHRARHKKTTKEYTTTVGDKRIPICPVCGENVEIKVRKNPAEVEDCFRCIKCVAVCPKQTKEVITELLVICYTCGTVFESFKAK